MNKEEKIKWILEYIQKYGSVDVLDSKFHEEYINNCKPNFDNIEILKQYGFNVFPGDKDSFGWLTGCIRTKKVLSYLDNTSEYVDWT